MKEAQFGGIAQTGISILHYIFTPYLYSTEAARAQCVTEVLPLMFTNRLLRFRCYKVVFPDF